MMKFLKTIGLSLSVGLASLGIAKAQTVNIGWSPEPYPPFIMQDAAGNWSGWEVEFKEAVCKEAKLDCQIVLLNWDGLIPALQSKKIDLIINSMSITDERKKVIDFTNKYYDTPTVLMSRKGDTEVTPERLDGKIIGVIMTSIQQNYAEAHYADKAAEIKEYQNQAEMYQDLAAGRIDAVLYDSIAISAFLKSETGGCCENKGSVPDDAQILGSGVGIGLRQGEDELKTKLNAAIDKIRADGTYEAFSKKYFDFDIYGSK
jgi:polar amino acid transport system substrate-binding protein